jgi:hypothetical protein
MYFIAAAQVLDTNVIAEATAVSSWILHASANSSTEKWGAALAVDRAAYNLCLGT